MSAELRPAFLFIDSSSQGSALAPAVLCQGTVLEYLAHLRSLPPFVEVLIKSTSERTSEVKYWSVSDDDEIF